MIYERVPTDNPIRHIWSRFEVLSSISGTRAFLLRQAAANGHPVPSELLDAKARGIAFSIRTASEYFLRCPGPSLTSSGLASYYGTLYLLEAMILSDTSNTLSLPSLEEFTSAGHGLGILTVPGIPFPTNEQLFILPNGFLPRFLRSLGYDLSPVTVAKRYKDYAAVPASDRSRLFSVKDLLARVPELREIYLEIFREQPAYISFVCEDGRGSDTVSLTCNRYQNSKYLTEQHIRDVMQWTADVQLVKTPDAITTAEPLARTMFNRKTQYRSVLAYDTYIQPLLGIEDALVIKFILLYALSIWARYRPALWRDIVEGEHDLYRPLFTQLLFAVERVVPNDVLNRIYNVDFNFVPFSYLS